MTGVINITKKSFAFLLIAFVGLLVANEAVYRHTHHINGHTVTHAHPYDTSSDDQPSQTHRHSKAQIAFFNLLELLFPVFFLVFFTLSIPKPLRRAVKNTITVYSSRILNHQGRAPPVS